MTGQKSRAHPNAVSAYDRNFRLFDGDISLKESWLELSTHSLSSADFVQEKFSRATDGKSDAASVVVCLAV